MTLESLFIQIQQNWSRVLAPNADRAMWDLTLAQAFPGYTIVNLTDLNYGKCHTYQILLPYGQQISPGSIAEELILLDKLGGEQRSILLKLSIVAPYYLLELISRKLGVEGQLEERIITPATEEEIEQTKIGALFAQQNGYAELPSLFLNALVPDAELELAEPGTVTVYNCLFEDQTNHISLLY